MAKGDQYYLMGMNSQQIIPIRGYHVIVVAPGDRTWSETQLRDAADNVHMSIIDLKDHLDGEEEEAEFPPPPAPDAPEVLIDRAFLDVINERMEEIEDPNHSLDSTEFTVLGVKVRVE